jgi:hypothetical protein
VACAGHHTEREWNDMFPSYPGADLPHDEWFERAPGLKFGAIHPGALAYHGSLTGAHAMPELVRSLIAAAQFNQNPAVITTLLKAGADVRAQTKDGETALMHAAASQNSGVIITLLKAGADIKAQDKDDWTPPTGTHIAPAGDRLRRLAQVSAPPPSAPLDHESEECPAVAVSHLPFEACPAFTHITACMLADPPRGLFFDSSSTVWGLEKPKTCEFPCKFEGSLRTGPKM